MQTRILRSAVLRGAFGLIALTMCGGASAQPWVSFDNNTRYLALGDSLSAGYAAQPVTEGFVFRLYQSGSIDKLNNLHFCAGAIPNARSSDVLNYQVPQVPRFFKNTGTPYRKVVTLTVGGNDALSVLGPGGEIDFPAIPSMLNANGGNLYAILATLTAAGDVRIFVGNLYDPKLPVANAGLLIDAMNQVTAGVVSLFPGKAVLVDLHSAFEGRHGLLLIEKHGAAPDEVHPTNAGYGVIASAFKDAIVANNP